MSSVRFHLDRIHSGTGSPELCWVTQAWYDPGTTQFQARSLSQVNPLGVVYEN